MAALNVNNRDTPFIIVAGFGSTGSSAYVDLLSEYAQVSVVPGEVRLLQDPDGLVDICTALDGNWSWLRPDAEIRRFMQFVEAQAQRFDSTRLRTLFGVQANPAYAHDMRKAASLFSANIATEISLGYWHFHDNELSACRRAIERAKWAGAVLGLYSMRHARSMRYRMPMYFLNPSADIVAEAQKMFANTFASFADYSDTVVLDQAMTPYNRVAFRHIVGNTPTLIVLRDPRDVFLDTRTWNAYPKNIDSFIVWYRESISKSFSEPQMSGDIFLQFEHLVRDYEGAKGEIERLLGGRLGAHVNQFQRFDPNVSKLNVGMWSSASSELQSDLEFIKSELSIFCVDLCETKSRALRDLQLPPP